MRYGDKVKLTPEAAAKRGWDAEATYTVNTIKGHGAHAAVYLAELPRGYGLFAHELEYKEER